MSSTANPPCAACKLQRRKCTPECVFAPYFPAENPGKFACVHKVFGASNVAKMLKDLSSVVQREEAVRALAYEAEARVRDPVYGCTGTIVALQQRLNQLQSELMLARKQLADAYIGQHTVLPNHFMGFNRQERFTINVARGGGPYQMAGTLVSHQWTVSHKRHTRRPMGPYTRSRVI